MVLDLLIIGLVITLYPLPPAAFVLVVSAPRGVWKGLAFILAWLACLVAVIAAVLLLTDGQPPPPRSPPSTAALVIKLLLGLGLIAYSEHKRRQRRKAAGGEQAAPGEPVAPKTSKKPKESKTSRMDQVTVWSAASIAVLLQPWGMVGLAATTVVEADLSNSASFVALFAFCILATSSLLAMELYMVFAPQRAHLALTNLHAWLQGHKEPAIVITCLVLGLWVVARSLYELTS
ncbi:MULTISPECIES: GAP family protein [unclassified Streptomyces]|uniref:GAP family protein n=1 Tax=unclassified Streptomyces TaxID=2593676 RepID=UPI0004C52E27|nr:GAP family protein [Streptomyces sp. NRRL F-2747]